jgi:hypothetical protein
MSSSFILPLVLQSALLPFGVALVILLAARKPGWHEPAAPLAVLIATLASYFAIHPQWSPLPRQALDWLPWIGLLAVAAAIAGARVAGAWMRVALYLVLGAAVGLMVLAPILANLVNTEPARLPAILASAGCLVALAWIVLGYRGSGSKVSALVLTVVAGGAGLALMIDASQSLGQLNGALAMACAACFVFGLAARRAVFGPGAAGTALLLLAALLLNAHVYAGFSLVYIALLVAGLAGATVPALLRASGKNDVGALASMMAALVAAVPVLTAVGLVLQAAQESGGY